MTTSGEAGRFDANERRALQLAQRALGMVPANGPALAVFEAIKSCVPVAAGMLSLLRMGAHDSMVNHGVRIPPELLDAWMSAPPEHLAHALGPILAAPPGALLRDAETIHGEMREQLEALRALGTHGLGEGAGYKVVERSSPAYGSEHVMLTLLTERGDVIPERSKALLAALNPAIQAAVLRLELPFVAHRPVVAQILQEQAQGYVCLSPSGTVLESNRRAHELAVRYHTRAGLIGQRRALADLAQHALARARRAVPLRIHSSNGLSVLEIYVHHLRKEIHALGEDIMLVAMREWNTVVTLDVADCLASLTKRQREIAIRLGARTGRSYKEIAVDLGLQEGTVRKHAEAIYRALGVHSRHELAALFTT